MYASLHDINQDIFKKVETKSSSKLSKPEVNEKLNAQFHINVSKSIKLKWRILYLAPGKSGRKVKSSAIIAPTAHISIAGE